MFHFHLTDLTQTNQVMLKRMLRGFDYTVDLADDGVEGRSVYDITATMLTLIRQWKRPRTSSTTSL